MQRYYRDKKNTKFFLRLSGRVNERRNSSSNQNFSPSSKRTLIYFGTAGSKARLKFTRFRFTCATCYVQRRRYFFFSFFITFVEMNFFFCVKIDITYCSSGNILFVYYKERRSRSRNRKKSIYVEQNVRSNGSNPKGSPARVSFFNYISKFVYVLYCTMINTFYILNYGSSCVEI